MRRSITQWANLLFRVIVRRLHVGLEEEAKIVLRHIVSATVFAFDDRVLDQQVLTTEQA